MEPPAAANNSSASCRPLAPVEGTGGAGSTSPKSEETGSTEPVAAVATLSNSSVPSSPCWFVAKPSWLIIVCASEFLPAAAKRSSLSNSESKSVPSFLMVLGSTIMQWSLLPNSILNLFDRQASMGAKGISQSLRSQINHRHHIIVPHPSGTYYSHHPDCFTITFIT